MGLTLGQGTLYFGDVNKAYKSISVKEISLVKYAEDTNQIKKPINNDDEFTFTIETRISRNTMLSLLYGRKITNNWLKMHGGIMARNPSRSRKSSRHKHSL